MQVKISWWIDNGFSLDEKLALRRKLAEFPRVILEDGGGEVVTAVIPFSELATVIPAAIAEIKREKNCWIWISLAGDKQLVNQIQLSKTIAQKVNYAVYSFLAEGEQGVSAQGYGEIKKKILANQIPVFCLSGIANLHDDSPKVILDFLQQTIEKKITLKTDNIRFGYIIKKEITGDKKLQDALQVKIEQTDPGIGIKLTATSPAALERAVNKVIKQAKAFKLELL